MSTNAKKTIRPSLYKYGRLDLNNLEHTKIIFKENRLYFAAPIQFNDPYDTKVNITLEGTAEEIIELWNKGGREKGLGEINIDPTNITLLKDCLKEAAEVYRKNSGVLSLTTNYNDIIMWSHYADQHRGFCLKFNPNVGYFKEAEEVQYSNKLPSYNYLELDNSVGERRKLGTCYLTKYEKWKYEEEWRILKLTLNKKEGNNTHEFPEESLTGIIFGYRMQPEIRSIIINWCEERKNKPKLYITKPKEDEYDLGIEEYKHIWNNTGNI